MVLNRAPGLPRADTNSSPSSSAGPIPITQTDPSGSTTVCITVTKQSPNQPLDQKSPNDQTRLIEAVRNGRDDEVQKLLDNPNRAITARHIHDALRDASARGYARVVETLITRGARINGDPRMCRKHFNTWGYERRNTEENLAACEDMICGKTALRAAAEGGNTEIVLILLKAGAKDNAPPAKYFGRTALQAAAGGGHADVVSILLEAGAKVNAPPAEYFGITALQAAAGGGYADVVLILLEAGAVVNAPVEHAGRTTLQAAAGGGHADVVSILLEAGAVVNAPPAEYSGRTALQAAAGGGHADIVSILLEAGAVVNAPPAKYFGRTALQAAAGGGHADIVSVLLEAGANVNAPAESDGRTALQAAAGGGHADIVSILLEAGANVNAPAEHAGRTALQAAAGGGHADIVSILLQTGAEVNAPPAESGGRTALQAAAEGGNTEIVLILLEAGGEVNAPPAEYSGRTALQAAAGDGHADVVSILLEAGAKVDAPPTEYNGRTALQAAAGGGHADVVSILLEAGAKVDAPPTRYFGITAFKAAAEGGHADVVSILLKVGVGTELEHGGVAILMTAVQRIHIDVVSILLNAGVDINARDKRGQTCLSWGIASSQLVQLLLVKGAKINVQALDGTTPLHYAVQGLHAESASILLNAGANTESEDYENRKPLDIALHDLDPSLESSNLVTLLLKHGCDIGRRGINSWRKMLRANTTDAVVITETSAPPSAPLPFESSSNVAIESNGNNAVSTIVHGKPSVKIDLAKNIQESVIFNVSSEYEYLITRKLFSIFETGSKTSVLLLKFRWNGKITPGFSKLQVPLMRTGVEWQWFLLDGDFTPSSYGFSNVGNLTREVDKQALLSCYVSFEFLTPYLTTDGKNISNNLGNAFQVQKRRSEISWTMRKPCIYTGQFDSSDPKPAPIFRTEDFRSTLDIGWIPENGLDFFTLFVVDLHKKWRVLLEEVDSHLIVNREILLLKKGRTTNFIDNLLLDAQQWSNFRALLQTHVREARNVAKDFEERRYLCDEVEDPRAAVKKLQDTIERMEAEVRSEIKKFDEKTKEMIELEFNLVSIHEVRTSKTMGMSMKRLSWITFIFLPLMFVTSLFGMNVDLVNGSTAHWWVVIALSIALFTLVILGWALLKSVRAGEYFEDSDCTANPTRLEAFSASLKRIRRGQWSAVKGDLGADLESGRAEVSGAPEFKRPSRQWTYKLKEL